MDLFSGVKDKEFSEISQKIHSESRPLEGKEVQISTCYLNQAFLQKIMKPSSLSHGAQRRCRRR